MTILFWFEKNVTKMVSCCIVSNSTEFISYWLDSEPKTVNAFMDRPKVLCFPSIYMFAQSYSENMARSSKGNSGSAWLALSIVVQSVL